MPENNEKVEDFVSLWKKKMEDENKTSNAIGETLEKFKEVEEENERLRNKIQENIELITRTEEVIKKTIEENENLKKQIENSGVIDEKKLSEIQQENIMLNSKIISSCSIVFLPAFYLFAISFLGTSADVVGCI